MKLFKDKPICEICGQNEATSFSILQTGSGKFSGDWKFVCECTSGEEDYYIQITDYFRSPPSSVDWMTQMQEKSWMDWNNFMDMMARFAVATGVRVGP